MHDYYTPSSNDWWALLSISAKLDCPDIRRHAITQLTDILRHMEPFERVTYATKYHVDAWLAPAYEALCKREKPLSIDEGAQLGIELAMSFAEARERIRAERHARPVYCVCPKEPGWEGPCCYDCGKLKRPGLTYDDYDNATVRRIVQEVFKL